MASLSAVAAKTAFRAMLKRDFPSEQAAVSHFRRILDLPFPSPVPRGVSVQKISIAGVPCERMAVRRPGMMVLHLHGGAFIGGKLATYHAFAGRLARLLDAEVILPDYRLAPEHPFPAAPEDCMAVYRTLLECGVEPAKLAVTGDSAGGNLTLATLQTARDEGLALPRCAVAISPGADVSGRLPSWRENDRRDAMLSYKTIQLVANAYLGDHSRDDPRASPLCGDFSGLPPLLLTVSDEECLRDDAYAVASKARAQGVRVEMLSRPDLPHAWPILNAIISESRTDLRRIADFIRGTA
ncbi:alpha/beta hydrolase [Algiphilus sp. W345]|uniref:Alpha/beta hydrolase n=1 Tax=Banduia mediterranea TaxID=3075609 RepID=A0ABU2WF18_9GAMM|nr:alpha/beta hydrolase [Algiphilus sp. W345]MDT0496214.1 alpha/beta hydrolase [Algiphilus sp. W345]